jgi:hypothetical protein
MEGDMNSSPVSPGVMAGAVHVVLDPHNAQLAPGEILACPATDPSRTPLFLAAGRLVTNASDSTARPEKSRCWPGWTLPSRFNGFLVSMTSEALQILSHRCWHDILDPVFRFASSSLNGACL